MRRCVSGDAELEDITGKCEGSHGATRRTYFSCLYCSSVSRNFTAAAHSDENPRLETTARRADEDDFFETIEATRRAEVEDIIMIVIAGFVYRNWVVFGL